MERLSGISREEMVGWSDRRLQEIIVALGAVRDRTAEQEMLLEFLLDAALSRKEDRDPLEAATPSLTAYSSTPSPPPSQPEPLSFFQAPP